MQQPSPNTYTPDVSATFRYSDFKSGTGVQFSGNVRTVPSDACIVCQHQEFPAENPHPNQHGSQKHALGKTTKVCLGEAIEYQETDDYDDG
jgi:hypothetical protein